jgi:hypothetical protein
MKVRCFEAVKHLKALSASGLAKFISSLLPAGVGVETVVTWQSSVRGGAPSDGSEGVDCRVVGVREGNGGVRYQNPSECPSGNRYPEQLVLKVGMLMAGFRGSPSDPRYRSFREGPAGRRERGPRDRPPRCPYPVRRRLAVRRGPVRVPRPSGMRKSAPEYG